MRRRSRSLNAGMSGALVWLVLLAFSLAVGQAQTPAIPRMPDGKPNLTGMWQALGTAHWDIQDHSPQAGSFYQLGAIGAIPGGQGIVDGNDIPYQAWAAQKRKENFANRLMLDPEIKCYLPGVPRATYMPYPFQILQSASALMFVYEYAGAVRNVYLQSPGPAPADSWMGQSVGHWEGDALVVDVTDLNDQTWFDRAGNFHSDKLHVVERYRRTGPDVISYEATIDDPNVFTRPWKIAMPLYRRQEKNAQLLDFKCVEFVEELLYGQFRKHPLKE
jgi:hypothetical protein